MGNLKKELAFGIVYTGMARYFGIFVSVIVSSILARVISPSDFGVVALASIFITFFSVLTTVGISPAIIQNKTITDCELEEINTFTIIIAILLTFVFLLSVPLITFFYSNVNTLKNVLLLLSVSIFFSVAAIVPNAMLLIDKEFKFIAKRTFLFQLIFGVISVIGAVMGMGVYALLLNPIGTSVALFIVNFTKRPIGLRFPHKSSINKILSFSFYQMLFNFIYLIYRNIDKLVIGKAFGVTNLGYYEKSYRLMLLPLDNVSSIISPVLHPLLSEYQTELDYLWNAYKKILTLISEFSILISVMLFFLARPIIVLLYGENWEPAVPIFKVLALSICFQLIQAPLGAFFQSINRVKDMVKCSLYVLVLMLMCISISVWYDNFNILPTLIVIAFFFGLVVYEYYICQAYQKKLIEVLIIICPHFIYASFLFGLLYIATLFINDNNYISYSCVIILISTFYFLLLLKTNRVNNMKQVIVKSLKNIHNRAVLRR